MLPPMAFVCFPYSVVHLQQTKKIKQHPTPSFKPTIPPNNRPSPPSQPPTTSSANTAHYSISALALIAAFSFHHPLRQNKSSRPRMLTLQLARYLLWMTT
ncbi:hypothetical protein QQP08_018623 [Theobroma cacao]|nr:hypothetical protein QQP08_018623 [Theobroma cacao]